MPKELTHWLIATDALSVLDKDSQLKRLLKENLDCYLLGSVALDSPYSYPQFTTKQKEFSKIADKLHGVNGEDVFLPFKNMLKNQKTNIEESVLAFSIGFYTHIIVDTNFHPLVYYLTGNYYSEDKKVKDKAVSNHRWFEANIDSWFMDNFEGNQELVERKYLKDILKGVTKKQLIAQKVSSAISINNAENKGENYEKAFFYHGFFQRLLFIGLIKSLLTIPLGRDNKTVALFYPPKNKFKGDRTIEYLHPVTGEKRETNFEQLRHSTTEKLGQTLQDLEVAFYSQDREKGIEEFIANLPDRSLETGMYRAKSSDMKYFAQEFKREEWQK